MTSTRTKISTSSNMACPSCLGKFLHSSAFKLIDIPYLVAGFRAMRCDTCDHRFYRHRLAATLYGSGRTNRSARS